MNLRSIRTKFLVVLIPLCILSMGILAGVSYYVASNMLQNTTREAASELGQKFSWQIKYEVDNKMRVLEEFAANPVFHGTDTAAKLKILLDAKERNAFPSMMVLDPNGIGYGTNGKPTDRRDREYVKKVQETKQSYVPEPNLSAITNTLVVVLTTPIMDKGQMAGMITGTIDLGDLSSEVGNVKFKESGYGYIVDRSGVVIAHGKNPEFINKINVLKKDGNAEMKARQSQLDDRLMNVFRQVLDSGKQAEVEYKNFDGAMYSAVITPIELAGQRWATVVTAPVEEIMAEATYLAKLMWGISIVFTILVILAIYCFARVIGGQISAIRDECMELNAGDFREKAVRFFSEDEIGQLANGFHQMRQTLRKLICNVQAKSEQVAAASQQLTAGAGQSADAANQVAASITEIANGAQMQTRSAEETTGVAKDIASYAGEISNKARDIVDIANKASDNAESGRGSIAKAVEQMERIGVGSEEIQTAVSELAQGSKEISDIVDLISNIAGQTNLLALNAAIEAARAGEAGRGFAVVAEEVRKLAEESNQSSQKIGILVKRNQEDMEKAVIASKAGAEGVLRGMEAVAVADGTFKEIVEAIEHLSAEIHTISASIQKMSDGSQTMVKSIYSIDEVSRRSAKETESVSAATEQQSASMQEISSASGSLAMLADELQMAISKFKV